MEYCIAKNVEEIKHCIAVRHEVFVISQKVPLDREVDGLDKDAIHFAVKDSEDTVGTARVRIIDGNIAKIERVAILDKYRGLSLGKGLMNFILLELLKMPELGKIKLSSQTYVVPFYKGLGFTLHGDEYMDAGIPHYDMVISL